jgi:hypothetical protein
MARSVRKLSLSQNGPDTRVHCPKKKKKHTRQNSSIVSNEWSGCRSGFHILGVLLPFLYTMLSLSIGRGAVENAIFFSRMAG